MITIKGRLNYPPSERKPSSNDAHLVLRQIRNDAISGTYDEFPAFWSGKFERSIDDFASYDLTQEGDTYFSFELSLDESFFSVYPGGFQHLIGVLAGDLLQINEPKITITNVVLPESMRREAISMYRLNKAHSIDETRKAFALKDGEPLLAFSVKPRNGLRHDVLKDVTLGVLRKGFNIVELDTRNLSLQKKDLDFLIDLSKEASEVGKRHVTRFSPNLSVPSYLVLDLTKQFIEAQASPVVIKIDGGLDGISSVQAVRSAFSNDHSPIITSYPLLRRQLADKIANNLLIDALVLSGVDVIYIGSRPSLPSTSRELDAEKEENLRSSVLRYHRYVKENHSMPTVAGGINVAQLHSFYELLGPNVAFFLGGAISLQKKGPIEGASLCVRVIKNAAEVRQKIGHRPKYANLDSKLIKECENAYMNNYPYVSPQQLFSKFTGLPGWFTTDRK